MFHANCLHIYSALEAGHSRQNDGDRTSLERQVERESYAVSSRAGDADRLCVRHAAHRHRRRLFRRRKE